MKKIGFVGVFDKTDLILCISKILTKAEARVLFIDATSIQKTKYVIPTIMPTISYLTDYQGIDIAVGFGDINQVKGYCGIEENDSFEDAVAGCVRKVVRDLLKKETHLLKQLETVNSTEE